APTRVWRFTGEVVKGPASPLQVLDQSYLGPVIRLVRGQRVRIRFRNRLPEPSIVHWHGLDVPEAADGHQKESDLALLARSMREFSEASVG
ncbi:multicopper oxidase domain-containing protein, partial [Streptococcus pneumoniae]|uniref:multicopper oxidase domain-containing protein n=1 Tax=Streptococcus pneumoniae TaxID=1313 RepID=UPI0012D71F5C